MKTWWICFQHWSHSCLELQRVVRETFFFLSILMPCSPQHHNQEASIFSCKLKPCWNESGFLLAISKVFFFPWLIWFHVTFFFCIFQWNLHTCTAKQQPQLLQFFDFFFFLNFSANSVVESQKCMCSSKDTTALGDETQGSSCFLPFWYLHFFFHSGLHLRDAAALLNLSKI